jgi:hypothetical protein
VWKGLSGRDYGGNVTYISLIGIVTMNPPYNKYILIKIFKGKIKFKKRKESENGQIGIIRIKMGLTINLLDLTNTTCITINKFVSINWKT